MAVAKFFMPTLMENILVSKLSIFRTLLDFLIHRIKKIYVLVELINFDFAGSQWGKYNVFNYVFEKEVKLSLGLNKIALLSATVGFQVLNTKPVITN